MRNQSTEKALEEILSYWQLLMEEVARYRKLFMSYGWEPPAMPEPGAPRRKATRKRAATKTKIRSCRRGVRVPFRRALSLRERRRLPRWKIAYHYLQFIAADHAAPVARVIKEIEKTAPSDAETDVARSAISYGVARGYFTYIDKGTKKVQVALSPGETKAVLGRGQGGKAE